MIGYDGRWMDVMGMGIWGLGPLTSVPRSFAFRVGWEVRSHECVIYLTGICWLIILRTLRSIYTYLWWNRFHATREPSCAYVCNINKVYLMDPTSHGPVGYLTMNTLKILWTELKVTVAIISGR